MHQTISIAMDIRCLIVIEDQQDYEISAGNFLLQDTDTDMLLTCHISLWILLAPFCILGMIWILIDIEYLLL